MNKDSKQTSGCLVVGCKGWEGEILKRHEEIWEIIDTFVVLIVVIVTWVSILVKHIPLSP